MGKRSLKASAIGIAKAKHAFQRREWTQEYLASAVGLQTRQSIWKFFSGKPIERHLFVDICFQLDLDWEDIAERLQYDSPLMVDVEVEDVQSASTIDELVQEVRSHLNPIIQAQCGTLQTAIDLAQPLALEHVYTDVELLPCLTNQRWLEVTDLQPSAITDQPPLLTSAQTRIPALQAVAQQTRLLILGKPGAGKTTFLQHLALLCNAGNTFSHCVPAFVSLRDLAAKLNDNSFNFVQYISQQWSACQLSHEKILTLLQEGRVLLLLDGLDEVSGDIQTQLSSQIQTFADTYSKNPLIVTCRLAAQDYYFRGFTVMEMADFAPSQITTFVQKWFTSTNSANPEIGAAKAEQFLEQIQRPEHQSIRELAVTPILLHLACLVFQERSAFPKKRSRLYQTGLDILLVRWDKARGIQRDQTYHLSVSDRVNILSQIAATTFEQGKYFFEKAEIIPIIASYLGTLPDSDTDPETLWLNSEAVLQTIVLQHGLLVEQARDVYSFSHVTFQEYLTARRIFTNTSLRLTSSDSVIHADVVRRLQQLAEHVMDTRWHEVIALTIELLPHPNLLLMGIKEHINDWTSRCETVQVLLQWVARKTQHVVEQVGHDQSSAVRAFYLSLCQNRGLDLVAAIAPDLTFNLPPELALDLELIHALRLGQALIQSPSLQQSFTLSFALDLAHRYTLSNELQQKLQALTESLIDATQDLSTLEQWCQASGDEWMRELRQLLIEHRDIGYLWQFNATQHEQLQRHYQANLFFMRCLRSLPPSSTMIELTNILLTTCNSDCAFSKSVAPYA